MAHVSGGLGDFNQVLDVRLVEAIGVSRRRVRSALIDLEIGLDDAHLASHRVVVLKGR